MRCTVSSSNKRITCHTPTVRGTCTTGSWCRAWAALFCLAEGSCATSSSTSEGNCPFHLQPVSFLSAYLPVSLVVLCLALLLCRHLPVVLQLHTFECSSCCQLFCCIQTPPLPPICPVERMWKVRLPRQNTPRLC